MEISNNNLDGQSLEIDLQEDLLRRHAIGVVQLVCRDLSGVFTPEQVENELIPGAAMRSAKYICDSLKSAELLLDVGETVTPMPLLRAAYETAMRLLWASGEDQGWNRSLSSWCKNDIKFAKSLLEMDPESEYAQSVLKHRQGQLDAWGEQNSKGLADSPPFEQILLSVEKQDGPWGKDPLYPLDGKRHYANMYRPLSAVVHGHWVGIGTVGQSASRFSSSLVCIFCAQSLCILALRLSESIFDEKLNLYYHMLKEQYSGYDKLAKIEVGSGA